MKQFFVGLWNAIRRAPIAKWIKPLWKGALRAEAARATAQLKTQLLAAVVAEGPGAVDRVFDQSQERLKAAVLRQRWLPGDLEDRLAKSVDEWGDRAQDAAKKALLAGGIPALDLAMTAAADQLMATIESL